MARLVSSKPNGHRRRKVTREEIEVGKRIQAWLRCPGVVPELRSPGAIADAQARFQREMASNARAIAAGHDASGHGKPVTASVPTSKELSDARCLCHSAKKKMNNFYKELDNGEPSI